MKLGFICPNLPGHLNPMTALARQLQSRNHDVVFLYSPGANGLPFVPADEKDHINENRPAVSKMRGEDALQFSVRMVLDQTEMILKSLPATVMATGVDALLIDTVQFYAELGAIQLDMPYIHVSAAVHFDYSGYTPLSIYSWPHQSTRAALARNREGVAKFAKMLEGNNAGIRAHAKNAGLKIDWEDPGSTLSPLASITQVPRAFDFESSHWPPQFHHTGPFHDGEGREKVNFPWERLTGEPLIYASMGTIMNGRADVFRTIVAAFPNLDALHEYLPEANLGAKSRFRVRNSGDDLVFQSPQSGIALASGEGRWDNESGNSDGSPAIHQGIVYYVRPVRSARPRDYAGPGRHSRSRYHRHR